ncbi:helix-loop-helix domain-containing protein [Candidatus Bathyarchaeota archaeon]|nr:helix-loop-helix domain-containing protein [Candidatus Bathyarchaeota archaeon]
MDDPAYFPNARGGFQPMPGDNYTLGPELELFPSGDTIPRGFPGADMDQVMTTGSSPPSAFCNIDPSNAIYNSRDGSEDRFGANNIHGQPTGQQFEGGFTSFMPTPPDADGNGNDANMSSPAISPKQTNPTSFGGGGAGDAAAAAANKQRANRKKQRRHSTPAVTNTDLDKASPGEQGDDKTRNKTQLRTASRAPKKYSQSTARKPAETPEEVKARAAHNQVEQQYRKRLNLQFEKLLNALPQADQEDDGDEDDNGRTAGGVDKRISKAEVLDLARRRIKALERERAAFEKQNEELVAEMRKMQEEWMRRHGGPMSNVKVEM